MSKHLRNQTSVSPQVLAQPHETQSLTEAKTEPNATTPGTNNLTSFVPNDESLLGDHPNGDDPDKVPVTPELPDDQVPNMPGAILKHAREMLGMSLREVSQRLMLRVNTVSDIEHDRLNQPTAAQFAVQHLTAYARLVNIDPKAVVDLYMQNVRQVQTTAIKRAQSAYSTSARRKALPWSRIALAMAGALALVGIGIGIGAFMSSGSLQEDQSGALTLSPSAQVQQSMEPQEPFPPTESSTTETLPYDANTEMARQQAEALGTNDIIAKTQSEVEEPSADPLKDEAPTLKRSDGLAQAMQAQSDAKTEVVPANEPLTSANTLATKTVPSDQTQVSSASLPTAIPVNPAVKLEQQEANPKPATKEKPKSSADIAPTSLGAVRDVSSQVSIVSRNDIGSLNTVTVSVSGSVFLRIKGNGKVLKSGAFKGGEQITATGMPPLRIEVSDSSKIRVRYNGGTVRVPSGKNLGFDLPTR